MNASTSARVPGSGLDGALPSRVEGFGAWILDVIDACGQFALLALLTLRAATRPRFPALETVRQMEAVFSSSVARRRAS